MLDKHCFNSGSENDVGEGGRQPRRLMYPYDKKMQKCKSEEIAERYTHLVLYHIFFFPLKCSANAKTSHPLQPPIQTVLHSENQRR